MTFRLDQNPFDLAISPDGATLAIRTNNGRNNEIQLWDLGTQKIRNAIPLPQSSSSWNLKYSKDGSRLITTSREKKEGAKAEMAVVLYYDLLVGMQFEKISLTETLGCKLITEDGSIGVGYADGFADKNPRILDIWNKKSVVLQGHKIRPAVVLISPDRKRVATFSTDKDPLRIWEYPSGKLMHATDAKYSFGSLAASLSFSPDSKTLAIHGLVPRGLLFFDVESGKTIGKDLNKLGPVILPVRGPVLFLADGKHVVCSAYPENVGVSSRSQDLEIWNVATQKKVKVLQHTAGPSGNEILILSPDGKLLARSSGQRTIHIWQVPDLLKKGGK